MYTWPIGVPPNLLVPGSYGKFSKEITFMFGYQFLVSPYDGGQSTNWSLEIQLKVLISTNHGGGCKRT